MTIIYIVCHLDVESELNDYCHVSVLRLSRSTSVCHAAVQWPKRINLNDTFHVAEFTALGAYNCRWVI